MDAESPRIWRRAKRKRGRPTVGKGVERPVATRPAAPTAYNDVLGGIVDLLEAARHTSARAVNALMTAAYWDVGRRIVQHEQAGASRAEYGEALLKRLAADLTARFGRGFAWRNLYTDARLLSCLPGRFADAVCKIRRNRDQPDFADGACKINPPRE